MKNKKILIIDDEDDICLLLSSFLQKKGYDTRCAQSIKEAKIKFVEFNPHIVFLDLNLPDGSGYSLAPQMMEYDNNLEIIIISAYDNKEERQKAHFKGIDHFIGKPFKKDLILETLKIIN